MGIPNGYEIPGKYSKWMRASRMDSLDGNPDPCVCVCCRPICRTDIPVDVRDEKCGRWLFISQADVHGPDEHPKWVWHPKEIH